ncbi:MAG TPA: hypothetical protein VGS18_04795, partial [Thermoplasmata archaeon]|nr:hypothetical protein [Thermoplasmata archaeon]
VNGELASLNSSSPYQSTNIRFVGGVSLLTAGALYEFDLSRWIGPTATIAYGSFRQLVPVSAGTYDVAVTRYSSTSDAVAWNSTESRTATVQFEFSAVQPGSRYAFYVDGAMASNFTATSSSIAVNWTGNGSHAFSLTVNSSAPLAAGLSAVAAGSPLTGVTPSMVQLSVDVIGAAAPCAIAWVLGCGVGALPVRESCPATPSPGGSRRP